MYCERLADFEKLTAKQREVLHLLSESMTAKEIARELGISPSTVEQRIRSLRGRFGPLSRGELSRLYRDLAVAIELKSTSGQVETASSDQLEIRTPAGPAFEHANPVEAHSETPAVILAQACRSLRFYAGLAVGFTLGIVVAAATFAALALALRLLA